VPKLWTLRQHQRVVACRASDEPVMDNPKFRPPRQRKTRLTRQKRTSVPAFKSLVVMAVDSMLRRADRAQAGIQRLHDQALVGAERSRVGIRLGLPALSKPDDDTGTSRGECLFQTRGLRTFPVCASCCASFMSVLMIFCGRGEKGQNTVLANRIKGFVRVQAMERNGVK
jgi:hypothetical protein